MGLMVCVVWHSLVHLRSDRVTNCGVCRIRGVCWLGSCYIMVGYKTLAGVKTWCMAMR